MKIFKSIEELKMALHIERKIIDPYFFMFKSDEVDTVESEAMSPHTKNFFTINFNVENFSRARVGHTAISDFKNRILFNSPYQMFSLEPMESKKAPLDFTVWFSSDFFFPPRHQFDIQREFPFFKMKTQPYYELRAKQYGLIYRILEKMYRESIFPDPSSVEITRSYLTILLHMIKRFGSGTLLPVHMNRYEEITSRFEELILTEAVPGGGVSDYAELLGISPAYLTECTKKAVGLPAKKIAIDYSILQAKSLLIQTDKSIEEIAGELGYSETTNFIKFFKKLENKTPSSFRKHP